MDAVDKAASAPVANPTVIDVNFIYPPHVLASVQVSPVSSHRHVAAQLDFYAAEDCSYDSIETRSGIFPDLNAFPGHSPFNLNFEAVDPELRL